MGQILACVFLQMLSYVRPLQQSILFTMIMSIHQQCSLSYARKSNEESQESDSNADARVITI